MRRLVTRARHGLALSLCIAFSTAYLYAADAAPAPQAASALSGTQSQITGSWKLVDAATRNKFLALNFRPISSGEWGALDVTSTNRNTGAVMKARWVWRFEHDGVITIRNPRQPASAQNCAIIMGTEIMTIQCEYSAVEHMRRT